MFPGEEEATNMTIVQLLLLAGLFWNVHKHYLRPLEFLLILILIPNVQNKTITTLK